MAKQQEDFARLIARSADALNAFVFSLVPNRADADDLLQETMQRLWEHHEAYDPSRPFTPWACQFAYRNVLQYQRREAKRRKFFSNVVVESLAADRPTDDAWLASQRQALQHCLEKLCPDDRSLVHHRYAGEKSMVDLSEEQGQTANSLYKRLQRIRRQLVNCVTRRLTVEALP